MTQGAVSDDEIERILRYLDPNDDGVTEDEFMSGFYRAAELRRRADAEVEGKSCLKR